MHMADALLSPAVAGGMYAASAAAVAYSARKIKKDELGDSRIPLMAVSGAMVFAAQMVNFTIPGTGSSGHIGGGILLAALLGPFAGTLALAAVLIIQCLCFADGGLLALGCNIFNIAVIPCLLVFPLVMKPLLSPSPTRRRIWAASLLSSIIALQLGSFCIVLQTTASGIVGLPFAAFVLLMQPVHLAIGVVEGAVTATILVFVYAARPQIIISHLVPQPNNAITKNEEDGKSSQKKIIIVFACVAAITAGGLSLFASANPDGLEWSILGASGAAGPETSGGIFAAFAGVQERLSFMPGYDGPAGDGGGAPIAGLVGAGLVFATAGAAALIIRASKKKRKRAEPPKAKTG